MTTMTEEVHTMAKGKAGSKERFHVPLEPYQLEALEQIRAETGAPISAIIRRAIDRELEARGVKLPKGGRHGSK